MFFGLATSSWYPISFYLSLSVSLSGKHILCPTAYAFRFRFVFPASRSIFLLLHTFVAGNIVDSRAMAFSIFLFLFFPFSSAYTIVCFDFGCYCLCQ